MYRHYFVQVGCFGQVGRFEPADAAAYQRGNKVVVRTSRGLEVGNVMTSTNEPCEGQPDGRVLRPVTPEDELLIKRLEQRRNEAVKSCAQLLLDHGCTDVLMDAELLLDGNSLFFYFLGEVSSQAESLTGQLAEAYEQKAQVRRFTETLIEGCGPNCGTEDGTGCGTSCVSCAVAGACSRPTKAPM